MWQILHIKSVVPPVLIFKGQIIRPSQISSAITQRVPWQALTSFLVALDHWEATTAERIGVKRR